MDEQNFNQQNQPMHNTMEQDPQTAVMTTKQWLITYLIMMIPCVGWIMAIVWAFSSNGNLNRRNYCRAFLILILIVIALYAVLFIVFGAAMFAGLGL